MAQELILDDRKQEILKSIIANYLETGEPVGSRTISKMGNLNLSSATIRNEMSDLEEMGYVVQPRTSAGRVPTDKGYRFYVDQVMSEKVDSEKKSQGALLERVDKLENLLMQVAKVLAYNTQYASIVTSPRLRNKQVKFIQLSQVDEERLVAVIVVGDNVAKNQLIRVSRPLNNEEVLKFNILLNTFLQGISVDEINIELMQTMKRQAGEGEYADILEAIFEGIVDAVHQAEETHIYTSGASNILKYNELGDINKATALLETFEEQTGLSELADQTLKSDDKNIQIYIGDESPVQNMKDCSIVTSTYELPEGAKGTIGIIGPKRMDYKKVVSTLKSLTDELDTIFRKE
ncbi:MAG: heat-inducible transcription repressor HrcA [Eubacterium sp.]|nr:heat-inducible transcription repressor HrcA [Eubacterium sp.]